MKTVYLSYVDKLKLPGNVENITTLWCHLDV